MTQSIKQPPPFLILCDIRRISMLICCRDTAESVSIRIFASTLYVIKVRKKFALRLVWTHLNSPTGVEFRALCRPIKFLNTNSKNISLWIWLCAQEHCNVETGKGQTQFVASKQEAHDCLKYFFTVALRFPFIGTVYLLHKMRVFASRTMFLYYSRSAILYPVSIDSSHWKKHVQQHKRSIRRCAAAHKNVQSNILSSTIMSAATLLVSDRGVKLKEQFNIQLLMKMSFIV